jgi:geranylgeranyl transferase type-2 subunit alpha
LTLNPEFYTVWNHRRRILLGQWTSNSEAKDLIVGRILGELKFLTSLMLKFPKCYWIWNYRLWVLDQATRLLTVEEARSIWSGELALVGKMLSRDGRNFHGWRYRRMVMTALESEQLSLDSSKSSLARQELEYTNQMIHTNLSNFSAWHNRSKLIIRILEEEQGDDSARQKFLDEGMNLQHMYLQL